MKPCELIKTGNFWAVCEFCTCCWMWDFLFLTVQYRERCALHCGDTNTAQKGQRGAQRNENSPSKTFNLSLLWCEFMWALIQLWVLAAGRLTTAWAAQGMWVIGVKRQGAPLSPTIAAFCQLSCLHPEAQPTSRASSQKVISLRKVCRVTVTPLCIL